MMKRAAYSFGVTDVSWKDHLKVIALSNGRQICLPRSACVTEGELVSGDSSHLYVHCHNGNATLLPSYFAKDSITIGQLTLELAIKEITTADEMKAYNALTQFHYREQALFGRTARLLIQSFHPAYPRTIGYVELATPFYMNKPRSALLDRPYSGNGIEWTRWDKNTARKYINSVVRIARCVIYPEFRGVGLGHLLVEHAMRFARGRWQVSGIKPSFIEISADMLKYVPFADRAGLHFIGNTEGNLDRVTKDLEYLLSNQRRVKRKEIVREEAFGIVDQQVSRLNKARDIMRDNGWSQTEFLAKLKRAGRNASFREISLFRQVLSLPKPAYMAGLNETAEQFVVSGLSKRPAMNGRNGNTAYVEPLTRPIKIKNLTITHSSCVATSRNTSAVQHAFGLSPNSIEHTVIRDLSFEIAPGSVSLISGPSGSGKSTLLRAIAEAGSVKRNSQVQVPRNFRPAAFHPIRSRLPLIDVLAHGDVQEALQLLGRVSLSDAFVFLKRFEELSAGQQYRAVLAGMIKSNSNVWFADEFCMNLDLIAANSVCHRLRALAKELNVALVVASPQPEQIVRSLQPDQVIRLTTAWENEVLTGKAFIARLSVPPAQFRIPRISVTALCKKQLSLGRPALQIARDQSVHKGLTLTIRSGRTAPAVVVRVEQGKFKDLLFADVRRYGYPSKRRFFALQQRAGFKPDHHVTAVYLDPLP